MYNFLLILGLFLALPYYLFLILARGKYRAAFWGKFGFLPPGFREKIGGSNKPVIWVHAVSVGEVMAAAPILSGLERLFPGKQLILSTTTETGQRQAERLFPAIPRCYMPLDLNLFLRRAFRGIPVEGFVILETELWPNLIEYMKSRDVPVFIANARLSDRSFRRYRHFRSFFRRTLERVRTILAQSELDGDRFVRLGAPAERVVVVGNTKFDQVEALEPPQDLRVDGPVIVAGSTHPGEEEILLEAFSRVLPRYPTLHLFLVPRHPDRAKEVGELCHRFHIPYGFRSRTRGKLIVEPILIVDVIGELNRLYALASIAFVGGSLIPRGGHNLLEAAVYGIPVLTGPHTENFRDIARILETAGLQRVRSADEMEAAFLKILSDASYSHETGHSLQQATLAHRGATALTLAHLQRELKP